MKFVSDDPEQSCMFDAALPAAKLRAIAAGSYEKSVVLAKLKRNVLVPNGPDS